MSTTAAEGATGSWRAVIWPTLTVLLAMILGLLVYENTWKLAGPAVHRPIAYLAGVVAFVSIGFGPLLIYPIGRARDHPSRI